jgi:outer membrane protein assembly factor BamD
MFQEKQNEKAIALFTHVERYYEGTARDDTIRFFTAVSHFRRGDFFTSGELLEAFRRNFIGRTTFMEEAEYLIAMGSYFESPDPRLDQTMTQRAIVQFHEFLARYPETTKYDDIIEYLGELQQKLYDKSFQNAKVYYDIGNYRSAIHTFKLALAEYPESNRREDILYYLTKSAYILAENSIESLQRGRYLEMIDHYYDLISDFPETKYLDESRGMYDKVMLLIGDSEEGVEEVEVIETE